VYPGALARTYDRLDHAFEMTSPDQVGAGTCIDEDGTAWGIIGHFGTQFGRPVVFVNIVRPLEKTRAEWPPARRKQEEKMWQDLVEIERGRILRTNPLAASRFRRLKWRYHELVHRDEFAERRRLQHEALARWETGPRLCTICGEVILPIHPIDDWYESREGIVIADVRHKGCGHNSTSYGTRKRCEVCGKTTDSTVCIWHFDGMSAEIWLCSRHGTFETAKRLVLERKAKATTGVPVWFESEESARARSIVESDDLIVIHQHRRFLFAIKDTQTGTWYDPTPGRNGDRDIELLRVVLTRLVDMAWYLKEEVLDIEDAEVPKELRGGCGGEGVFYDDDRFRVELAEGDGTESYRFFRKRGHTTCPAESDYQSLLGLSQRISSRLCDLLDRHAEATVDDSVDIFTPE